jgi:uncharacterized damage-inducible protein DinB
MAHTTAERFQQLFEYEKLTQLKYLQSVSEAVKSGAEVARLQKAIQLLIHILFGRRLWFYRLGIGPVPNFQAQNLSVSKLKDGFGEMHVEWSKYLQDLSEAELSRIVHYRTMEGEKYQVSVEDILTQLYGHSLHHGAQVAYVLRECGFIPPETDFIFHVRKAED